MKIRFILALLAVAILLLGTASNLMAAPPPDRASADQEQILVKFQPGTSEKDEDDVHLRHGGKKADVIPGIDVQVVKVPRSQVDNLVRAYRGEARVKFAEPDYIAQAVVTPNDTYFSQQWGMVKIQAPQAWDVTKGSSTVRIAILDTGIDQDHEDLAAKLVANKNFTTNRSVDDKYGHGTHVAGIAAAITNNNKGVAGVGYNSTLMNVKVLGDTGSGNYSWVSNGIIWAADNGAKVINLSLGGYSSSDTLKSAVDYAWSKGTVIVAAAGNDNISSPLYPAYYDNVIAVAATTQSDAKASFSNYGAWVDVAAPGVDIYSTLPNTNNRIKVKNYGNLSGTSMATPHVSGVAALVFAVNPAWTNAQIKAKIQTAVDSTTGFTTAIGRINAYKAVTP